MGAKSESGLGLTLFVLLMVYIFNFLDRQIVAILAEPIARDLSLSDTQIGLMAGLAFALFYTIMGLPIARYADRSTTNRVWLIGGAVAVWSAFTVISGLAQTYTQMLLARIGVGIGEAGGTPPAHSLIADKVPPEKRARAISIYQMGPAIGSLMGLVLGGLLADTFGWRVAFMVVGLPGLILAIIVVVALRDPRFEKGKPVMNVREDTIHAATFAQSLKFIWDSRAFRYFLVVLPLAGISSYGMIIWATIFFQRSHGLTAGETGLSFGVVFGVASALGIWLGGQFSDRWGALDKRHSQTASALGLFLSVPFIIAALLIEQTWLAIVLFFPGMVLKSLYIGSVPSAIQGLVPTSSRAVASATMLFLQNLIGLGVGPLILGYFSDILKPVYGDDSVRYVLMAAMSMSLMAGIALWVSRKYLPNELDRYG